MSVQSPAATPPNSRGTPPWLAILNFIGRPDLFFADVEQQPRLWQAFLIPVLLAIAIPKHVFMLLQLEIDATVMSIYLQGLCTLGLLLLENALFAGLAMFIANSLDGKSSFKTMYVACSFAQIPYMLLLLTQPLAPLVGVDRLIYVVLVWSFALSLVAIKKSSHLPWWKASLVPILLFGISLPLIVYGGPASGEIIRVAVIEQKKKELQADLAVQDPTQAAEQPKNAQAQADNRHPPAPNITLHTADGKDIQLASLRGKVVVLDFWSTWCAPCRRALPFISAITADRKEKGVELYCINTSETKAVAESYLDKNNLHVTLCLDLDKSNALAMRAYNFPYMVIIDRRGNIQSIHEGYSPSDEEALTMEIESALAE